MERLEAHPREESEEGIMTMTAKSRVTLQDVKLANLQWFDPKAKRMLGDCRYWVKYGHKSGQPFLVRSTFAWTDMFGGPRRLHYRINPLDEKLDIKSLIDKEFSDMDDVREWLKEN
jgi:hypothetical protein